jgi:monoamine oxidase
LTLYTGADSTDLSAQYWDEDEVMLEGGNHIMLDGYDILVRGLAENIDIHLNTTVTHIHHHDSVVTVVTPAETYQADAVIVTLPLGILKQGNVIFDPALPQAKQDAIAHLKMGVLDRVILKFPYVFWPADCQIVTYFSEQYPGVEWFLNYDKYFHQPILMGFIGGSLAKESEKKSDAIMKEDVMKKLREYFGDDVPEPTAFLMTRWAEDPYTLGSYSYIPIGASGHDYDVLAEPVGQKIFFAGEATNKFFPGTTHGAYLSGQREADRLITLQLADQKIDR